MIVASLFFLVARCYPQRYELRKDTVPLSRQPYERYFTHDKFGREITFFVTKAATTAPLPVALFVQGSGNGSNFIEINERLIPQNGQTSLFDVAGGAMRLVIVEKPGVKFLERGGGAADQASPEFRREQTLERWSEAVNAALIATLKLPNLDTKHVLVMGHSEGGLVACKVAAENKSVTHCAVLAGGGVSQLYDLMSLARKGVFGEGISPDPEKRVQYLADEWRKVLADPMSPDKLFLGHPYRRWSTFLASSPIAELSKFSGHVYIGQGQEDHAVDPTSADALYAQLVTEGKDVQLDRIPGVDHTFSSPDDKKGSGWLEEMKRIVGWFLKP